MSYQPKVYRKQGGDELVVASGGVITVESGGSIDRSAAISAAPGAGITSGTGTVIKSSVEKIGTIIRTTIILDLTGLGSSTTDLDIIGNGAEPAYITQVVAATNGTILNFAVTCLELPAGGVTDIDFYSATEGTGVFDGGIGSLTETALITSGGAWANGTTKGATTVPAAAEYIYLTCGAGGTAGTYTAGKFRIVMEGYA